MNSDCSNFLQRATDSFQQGHLIPDLTLHQNHALIALTTYTSLISSQNYHERLVSLKVSHSRQREDQAVKGEWENFHAGPFAQPTSFPKESNPSCHGQPLQAAVSTCSLIPAQKKTHVQENLMSKTLGNLHKSRSRRTAMYAARPQFAALPESQPCPLKSPKLAKRRANNSSFPRSEGSHPPLSHTQLFPDSHLRTASWLRDELCPHAKDPPQMCSRYPASPPLLPSSPSPPTTQPISRCCVWSLFEQNLPPCTSLAFLPSPANDPSRHHLLAFLCTVQTPASCQLKERFPRGRRDDTPLPSSLRRLPQGVFPAGSKKRMGKHGISLPNACPHSRFQPYGAGMTLQNSGQQKNAGIQQLSLPHFCHQKFSLVRLFAFQSGSQNDCLGSVCRPVQLSVTLLPLNVTTMYTAWLASLPSPQNNRID